jgi:small subunit ribosomal protein S5e
MAAQTLPREVSKLGQEVKLFGKWDTQEYVLSLLLLDGPGDLLFHYFSVEVKDISLTDYIQIRHAVYLPHTAGRYAKKQFKKAQMPIVERLVDRLVTIFPYHRPC